MVKETKYGIISDIHNDPRIVPIAINILKEKGAEKLLINGDIGNQQNTLQDSQNCIAFVLDSIGKSGLETFVQPGSHEILLAYGPVMEHFTEQYSNIIDATKNQKVEQEGHHLVFLPGSDFLCGGEYKIGNNEVPSGKYIHTKKGLLQFEDFNQYVSTIQKGIALGAMQYSNMEDLKKLVTQPDKTIVVCHVPRKFNNLEIAVDMAQFGEALEDFNLQGDEVKEGSVFPLPNAKQIFQAGYPVVIKQENRGNKDLKNIYEELGIVKAVSGHFHESGHRANDRMGNHVQEGANVDELFWNSGYLEGGQTGILTVKGNKVNYENINISMKGIKYRIKKQSLTFKDHIQD
ncbi:hypothetical protein KAR52_01685 [Candidatus Pacearchaeota archaeon]|nr:hypothetical protein [Candidatus Pacearchaeota archaeon]